MRLSENILIVEDEEEWRGIYRRAVGSRGSGQRVEVAEDLPSAKRLISAAKFAVAFVDVGLDISDDRNVDGLQVMEWIRATGDETSIIVVTGRSGQDVLKITRDAILKYGAYDTVAKGTVQPSDIRNLLDGGLRAYREVTAVKRTAARDALRGDMEGVHWDAEVIRATRFKEDAGKFYTFLNQLFAEYLPVVSRLPGEHLRADPSTGLACGDYWSRAAGSAVTVCFGPEEGFDEALQANGAEGGGLLAKHKAGDAMKKHAAYGMKGVVLPLYESGREDFKGA
jgi:DNA-binding response OmpR family regulator